MRSSDSRRAERSAKKPTMWLTFPRISRTTFNCSHCGYNSPVLRVSTNSPCQRCPLAVAAYCWPGLPCRCASSFLASRVRQLATNRKAIDKRMEIQQIHLDRKSGGKSGEVVR